MKPMLARGFEGDLLPPSADPPEPDQLRDHQWCVEQKVDGRRLLVTAEGRTLRGFNSRGERSEIPKRIVPGLQVLVDLGAALDGELMADGTFRVFDMPFCGSLISKQSPWDERRATLEALFDPQIWAPEFVKLLPVARTTQQKRRMVRRIFDRGLEGYVLKRISSPYVEPRSRSDRSAHWLKVKNLRRVDAIVASFGKDKHNIQLEVLDGERFVTIGECSRYEGEAPMVSVGDVLEVEYLNAGKPEAPRLYQPHAKHHRPDKRPHECTLDQLAGSYAQKLVL